MKKVTFSTPYESDSESDECNPYIPLADGTGDDVFIGLKDADEIVISQSKIKVAFDYPLKKEFIFELSGDRGDEGFTRKGLAKAIIKQYEEIYAEEEKSCSEKVESIGEFATREWGEAHPSALMLNRRKTTGTYGIWGHSLGDLLLHTISHDSDRGVWTLGVDS